MPPTTTTVTTTTTSTTTESEIDYPETSVVGSGPVSEYDIAGKKRFTGKDILCFILCILLLVLQVILALEGSALMLRPLHRHIQQTNAWPL